MDEGNGHKIEGTWKDVGGGGWEEREGLLNIKKGNPHSHPKMSI